MIENEFFRNTTQLSTHDKISCKLKINDCIANLQHYYQEFISEEVNKYSSKKFLKALNDPS